MNMITLLPKTVLWDDDSAVPQRCNGIDLPVTAIDALTLGLAHQSMGGEWGGWSQLEAPPWVGCFCLGTHLCQIKL